MKIVVVIPTYCERENIQKLIPQIQLATKNLQHELSILIVDDNSPDKTADAVRSLMKNAEKIHLLTGNKLGLGAAYIRGMKYAIEKLAAGVVIEMDADFSHNPNDLPKLIKEIEKGATFVIGSRYIEGGKIKNWSFFRHWLSGLGNLVVRKALGLNKVQDCTAGFRAIKTDLIKKVNLDSIKANGYAFQVWLLYSACKVGAKIKEVPVEFVDREVGKTKLGFWDIIEGIIILIKLRFKM